MSTYYPLAVGNTWTYKMQGGKTFTNTVTAADGNLFTMQNSMIPRPQTVRKDGDTYEADNFEANNFQVFLKDNLENGDNWEINYRANNIENILMMTVKEKGMSLEVEGKTYEDVIAIEGDMKMNVNGNIISANYLVQYYYAKDVGLVLTTTSYGDSMGLVSCELG